MKFRCFLIVLLVLAVSLSHVSCSSKNKGNDEDTTTEEILIESEETEKIKYIYKTKYIGFEFVTDDQKREWRSALASLLNNEKTPVYEKGEGLVGHANSKNSTNSKWIWFLLGCGR